MTEAAPELEKAASLTPDNPELQVSLGDAYLNLGQDDKALATFDHAVELSATPLVWNNIAYQLSLKKISSGSRPAICRVGGLGHHGGVAQCFARSAHAAGSAAGALADRLLGHAGLGLFQRRQSRQGGKICIRRLGARANTAKSATTSDRFTRSTASKNLALRTYALSLSALRPAPETRDRSGRAGWRQRQSRCRGREIQR